MPQIDQSTVAIKESFGKYNDVLKPGCHCVPWFIGQQIAGKLSLRVQHVILKNDRSLTEVFKLFDLIHILTTDHATVTRITKEVKLVLEMKDAGVVGIDLSGNPKVGEMDHIFASFEICQRTRSSCYSALRRVLSRSLIRRKYMQCWTFCLRGLVMLVAWKRMHGEN